MLTVKHMYVFMSCLFLSCNSCVEWQNFADGEQPATSSQVQAAAEGLPSPQGEHAEELWWESQMRSGHHRYEAGT